jgi:heavy metal translocating P-type ATPase
MPADALLAPSSASRPSLVECEVVHVTLGRLRIWIACLSSDSAYTSKLNWLVESLEFVEKVRINLAANSLIVHYRPSASVTAVQANVLEMIQQAKVLEVPADVLQQLKAGQRPEIDWLGRLGLPVFSLGLALLAQELLLPIAPLFIGGLVAAAAIPFWSRLSDIIIHQRRLDADILDAIWLGMYTLKGDFVAPALMLSLMETGEALRDVTARANERQAFDLLGAIEQSVRVERDGQEQWIALKDVQLGDRVLVYAGEVIPVSGRVLRGTALIDEHKLTGESTLVSRSEGQVVHASTQLLEGRICVLTKRIGKNTRLGLTMQLLQSAPVHDTRIEDYAGKIADATIMPSLLLSGLIFAATRDLSRAMAPLHLDFSHSIRIAVPSTVLSALTYAARHGIYIRSGRALEMLSRVDTIVFDKTGTLTQGNAAVVAVKTTSRRIAQIEVLRVAASAEQGNTHPVAKAILNYAKERQIEPRPCSALDYRIGFGVVGVLDDERILVGNARLLQQEGIDTAPIYQRYPDLTTDSNSLVYVARSGKLLGVILYTDPLRPESQEVISLLHSQGNQTYMLTGDGRQVSTAVANQVGIVAGHIHAEAFPDRKVEFIRQLQDQGRTVAFVGEGINDAAALAHADVSISFASGIDIAREAADVVLLDDDLRGIPHAIAIAHRAMAIVYQNTTLITIPNIGVVAAGILFALDPVLGVVISNGSALLAELNSFRPLFDPGTDPLSRLWQSPPLATEGSETVASLNATASLNT